MLFHARALLYAGEVGGTHPVLLEAMAAGRLILYNDTAENRETVGEAGLPFGPGDEESLRTAWARMHRHPEWIDLYGDRARQRAAKYYRWQTVTEAYEAVFRQAATEHPA